MNHELLINSTPAQPSTSDSFRSGSLHLRSIETLAALESGCRGRSQTGCFGTKTEKPPLCVQNPKFTHPLCSGEGSSKRDCELRARRDKCSWADMISKNFFVFLKKIIARFPATSYGHFFFQDITIEY